MSSHDSSKPFPPLAPGPSRTFAPQSSTAIGRPKKSSTACLACKLAKRKCSGAPSPCKACLGTGVEIDCHFDPSRDLRRKVGVKRTIQELSDHKYFAESLLTTLRTASRDKIEDIIELVQNNRSIKEIAHIVGSPVTKFADSKAYLTLSEDGDQGLKQFEPEIRRFSEISTSPEEVHSVEYPRAGFNPYARVTLESLCDIPLFRVPAKPWTEVTDDNDLVSHLISLYFTWDHPCTQFFDQGVFLDHMDRGDLISEFCTPLLVNSILSMASAYSDSPDVLANPENSFSRGRKFFEEAERLWKEQKGHISLSNIQAILLISCVLSYQGEPSLSWNMLRQAVQMGQEMGLFTRPRATHASEGSRSPMMERVRTITAWGIFSLNLEMSMRLQKNANLALPASRVHVGGDADIEWTPYPRSNQITYDTRPAQLPRIRQGLAELTAIMTQFQDSLYEEGLHMGFDAFAVRMKDRYNCLEQWLADWPDAGQIEKDLTPQFLVLRIKCLQAVMYVLEMLMERDEQGSSSDKLQQTWCRQAVEVAQCLRIYRQLYGIKHAPSQVVDAVQTILRMLAYQLEDSNEARHAFTELCRFGVGLSQRFKPTAETISMIHSLSHRGTVRLPIEAIEILDGSELRRGGGERTRRAKAGTPCLQGDSR